VAFVLAGFVFRAGASMVPAASAVALPQGLAFARRHAPQYDDTPPTMGFERLTEEVAAAAAACSADGRLVYLEADFFGAVGSQAAVGWEGGRVAFGPRLTQTLTEDREGYEKVPSGQELAINPALRWLGASASGAADEFDALNLSQLDELR